MCVHVCVCIAVVAMVTTRTPGQEETDAGGREEEPLKVESKLEYSEYRSDQTTPLFNVHVTQYTPSHNTHHHYICTCSTMEDITQYTPSHSTTLTQYTPLQCTPSHNAHHHTIHTITQCTPSHNTHHHTIHTITFPSSLVHSSSTAARPVKR